MIPHKLNSRFNFFCLIILICSENNGFEHFFSLVVSLYTIVAFFLIKIGYKITHKMHFKAALSLFITLKNT